MITSFNITTSTDIEKNYNLGLLPQRNNKNLFYQESSARSNLARFSISSENRRIIRKTESYSFQKIPLNQFSYTPQIQKTIKSWIKDLSWDFPVASVKNIFTNHIFNYLYIWSDSSGKTIAYAICFFSDTISHIAYVFYDPKVSHHDLPIRLVIQFIQDSFNLKLKYSYLGRFSKNTGYYKRNMPGLEFFVNGNWIEYNKENQQLLA